MPENTPQTYTPTPWYRNVSPAWKYPIYAGDKGDWTYVGSVTAPGSRNRNLTDEACEGNLNLIIAAVNSYALHCGPNAIQCAEDDLLGQAKEALKIAVKILDAESDACGIYKANREIIDNVLSRLSRESVASESPRTEQGVGS